MTAPITLPRLDTAPLAQLRQRYEETSNVESRTRYQMLLLAQQDYKVPQIARIVLRSEDTFARVLNRFLAGGLEAVPRRAKNLRAMRRFRLFRHVLTHIRVSQAVAERNPGGCPTTATLAKALPLRHLPPHQRPGVS